MESIKITDDHAWEILSGIVEKFGKGHFYVRPMGFTISRYVHNRDSEPTAGCLFGHFFPEIGIKLSDIPEGYPIDFLLREFTTGLSQEFRWAALRMQELQDGGSTWGYVLSDGREDYNASMRKLR